MKKSFVLFLSFVMLTGNIQAADFTADEITSRKQAIQRQIVSESGKLARIKSELTALQGQIADEIRQREINRTDRNFDLIFTAGSLIATSYFLYRGSTVTNDPKGLEVAILAGIGVLVTGVSGVAAIGRTIQVAIPSQLIPKLEKQLAEKQVEISALQLQLSKDFLALQN